MKLVNPTDKVLDKAFAEHVAGFYSIMHGYGYPCREATGVVKVPNFTKSADAVLPWLDKVGMWKAERFLPADICMKGAAYRVDVANRLACDFCHGDDDTFPRAAVIALLRAYGIEIEFTK